MSHFAVIVIGDDPERQLAAYDENDDAIPPEKRKWDWYLIGGRWTGYFRLRPGGSGTLGDPGLMTPPAPAGHADQCRWGDVDWDDAMIPFALVVRGEWIERGQMRWFARVDDEMDKDEWEAKVRAILFGLAPDTLVTAVDCHV